MLYLLIGIAVGALVTLVLLRPRLAQLSAVRRDRDLLQVRLESKQENDEDRFRALSAEALRSNNEQFLALARQALGTYQTEARSELEKREKAVAQLVGPIA